MKKLIGYTLNLPKGFSDKISEKTQRRVIELIAQNKIKLTNEYSIVVDFKAYTLLSAIKYILGSEPYIFGRLDNNFVFEALDIEKIIYGILLSIEIEDKFKSEINDMKEEERLVGSLTYQRQENIINLLNKNNYHT